MSATNDPEETAVLDAKLAEIIALTNQQFQIQETAREYLYRALATTYFWWRDAQLKDGYLDKLYEAENIVSTRNMGNGINFKRVIRLAFPTVRTQDTTVGYYNKAMNVIYRECIENEKKYGGDDKIELLKRWIKTQNGLDGLRKIGQASLDKLIDDEGNSDNDDDDDTSDIDKTQQGESKKSDAQGQKNDKRPDLTKPEYKRKIIASKTDVLKGSSGFAVVSGVLIPASKDELIVLLARKDQATGRITVVGSTTDQDILNDVIFECGEIDIGKTPPMLRLLIECLRVHIVPKPIYDLGLRNRFIETTRHPENEDEIRQKLPRLTIRKDGSILVGKSWSDASLITISSPKAKVIELEQLTEDLTLASSDRFYLESWISRFEISVFDCEPKKNLSSVNLSSASRQLTLINQLNKKSRKISFYDADLFNEGSHQCTIDDANIRYVFEIDATKQFASHVFSQSLQPLVKSFSNKFHLEAASRIAFIAHSDSVEIQSFYHTKNEEGKNENGFTQYGDEYKIYYGKNASAKLQKTGQKSLIINAYDLYELFSYVGSSLQVFDKLVISGNEFLMKVEFETDIAKHTAFIPTLDESGKRQSALFTKYVP